MFIVSCDPITHRWSSWSPGASITTLTRLTLITGVNIHCHGNMITYKWSRITSWSLLTINSRVTNWSSRALSMMQYDWLNITSSHYTLGPGLPLTPDGPDSPSMPISPLNPSGPSLPLSPASPCYLSSLDTFYVTALPLTWSPAGPVSPF